MNRKKRNTFNEINITPLTDIFLVLLIIMMVIAPLLDDQGLKLSVPSVVETKDIQKDSKILNILVTNENKIYIDGNEINDKTLCDKLKSIKDKYEDGVLIQTESNATHGTVVKIMDSVREAGIFNISVAEV